MNGVRILNLFKGIEKLFASLVFTMLPEERMISEDLMENMRNWKHSGFSVYCAEPIEACDDNGRKTLSLREEGLFS